MYWNKDHELISGASSGVGRATIMPMVGIETPIESSIDDVAFEASREFYGFKTF